VTIRQRVKILPGGTIEIHDPQLPDGAEAEVLITFERSEEEPSLVSFIGKGKGCFADAAEVDSFLRSERESWDR
jgi:hypothetical protein